MIGSTERYPDAVQAADKLIAQLNMRPTGIGGYLAEGPGGGATILDAALPERFKGDRKDYSINYYLLKANEVLKLHALNQDEQWFFHQGSAIALHLFGPGGYQRVVVGGDLDQGQVMQAVAPGQQLFGAELLGPGYALVSCSLAPGWDKRDSRLPLEEEVSALSAGNPAQAGLITRLTA
ncbi:FIG018171: hypothetical protein of Cupin superfamily [Janthinobacterium sp. CG23_2]|nr:FIG018171: hypothetical protein of Cupin superfamily [Janthinobacterium sp. CG23_2]CUU27078.1 FIG018171: hypothetical protein of Cupin superfamily [Janthinobacterium sp. CG23_2]